MKVVVDDISYTFRQFLLDKKNIYSLIYFFMIPIFFSTEFFSAMFAYSYYCLWMGMSFCFV